MEDAFMFAFLKRFSSVLALWALSCFFASAVAGVSLVSKPTIVLVHGAFAESSSWNAVITELAAKGYPTIAAANPLRGVKSDADYIASIVSSIKGPIILVGHSYGGSVIS